MSFSRIWIHVSDMQRKSDHRIYTKGSQGTGFMSKLSAYLKRLIKW